MVNIGEAKPVRTRTLRFHECGEPSDVLRLEEAELPGAAADRIRVRVEACGLNPADWTLCRGLFPGNLPRGIGLDVSGTVDAVGEGVRDVAIGDAVRGQGVRQRPGCRGFRFCYPSSLDAPADRP